MLLQQHQAQPCPIVDQRVSLLRIEDVDTLLSGVQNLEQRGRGRRGEMGPRSSDSETSKARRRLIQKRRLTLQDQEKPSGRIQFPASFVYQIMVNPELLILSPKAPKLPKPLNPKS